MKRIEITSANTAGMRVTSGASSDRKMSSSRMTMNSSEKTWILLPVLEELLWFATLVATEPAGRKRSPAGGRARAKVACRSPAGTCV